jgi:hypothetical protein
LLIFAVVVGSEITVMDRGRRWPGMAITPATIPCVNIHEKGTPDRRSEITHQAESRGIHSA